MCKRNSYPFNRMNVGDYEKLTFPTEADSMKARIASGVYGCTNGMKFVTRVTDGIVFEVWRIK